LPTISETELELLRHCETRIGYFFQDPTKLKEALTHASGAHHRLGSNERMEFLGDAILGFIICESLFEQFPNLLEGDLTKIKSVVVSRITCAKISEELALEEFLIVGKGMSAHARVPRSVLADVCESLIAAIYLDGGDAPVREFIIRHMQPEIDRAAAGDADDNYKSLLQHMAQRDFAATPTYVLLEESGPDHNKSFKVSAFISGREFPPAWGSNKKEAEQRAASNALASIGGQELPFPIQS
jgi:ribonuclease-3